MLKIVSTVCAAAIALSVPFAAPAIAVPKADPAWSAPSENVVKVQDSYRRAVEPDSLRYTRRLYQDNYRDHWRDDRHWRGDRDWRDHRRYRHYYRDRDGDGIGALGGFIAGAIVGGALAQQPRVRYYGGGSSHTEWCYNRYRSYRASDNTFQPYNGPRRQCNSPYG